MRLAFSVIFIVMIAALARCAHIAIHSRKKVGYSLGQLLYGLIPPVFGNLLIICTTNAAIAKIGCYIYFLGMDFAVFVLMCFATVYIQAHYAIDVIGGWVSGALIYIVLHFLYGKIWSVRK